MLSPTLVCGARFCRTSGGCFFIAFFRRRRRDLGRMAGVPDGRIWRHRCTGVSLDCVGQIIVFLASRFEFQVARCRPIQVSGRGLTDGALFARCRHLGFRRPVVRQSSIRCFPNLITVYRPGFRVAALATFALFLGGCPVLIQGNVRNDSGKPVFHLTDWKPFEEPIPIGESRTTRLYYPGACVELVVDDTSRYFIVPEPPTEAQLSGYWNPTYSVVLRPDGLFFEGGNRLLTRFEEAAACGD